MSGAAQTRWSTSDRSAPGALALVLIGAAWAVPLGSLALGSGRATVVALGALAGAVGLAWLLVANAARVTPLLFACVFLALTVTVDKYVGYQEHVGGWPGLRIAAADLFLVALGPIALALWLLGRGRNALPRSLFVLTGLLLCQYAFSAAFSPEPRLAVYEMAATLHSLVVAYLIAILFRRGMAEAVIYALALQVLAHTTVAIAQVATGRPIVDGLLGGRGEVLVETLSSGGGRLRPSGLFMHPIVYADFLFLGLPFLALGSAVVKARAGRWLLAATTLIGLAGLVLTLSRGAWLASGVTAIVLLWLARRLDLVSRRALRRIAVAAVVAGLVGAALFGPRVWQRLTQSDAGNVDVRLDLNRIALRMIADRPLHGQGPNAFVETMERFDPKNVKSYFPAPAHNLYLLEAAEAGLPALVMLLGVFATVIVNPLRRVGRIEDPRLRALVAATVAGLCGLVVSQLADFSFRLEPLRTLIWACIGLAFGALTVGEASSPRSHHVVPRARSHP